MSKQTDELEKSVRKMMEYRKAIEKAKQKREEAKRKKENEAKKG